MINGLAAALFVGMAILFLGIAVTTGHWLAWLMFVADVALAVGNFMAYGQKVEQRGK
jgi:hypothetical protein